MRLTRDEWKLRIPQRRPNSTRRGISHTTVDHVLRNPFYYGKLVVKGEVYQGAHVPLVSKETFDLVQLAMKRRAKAAPRTKGNAYTLGGLLWCGLCGRRLSGYRKRKKKGRSTSTTCAATRFAGSARTSRSRVEGVPDLYTRPVPHRRPAGRLRKRRSSSGRFATAKRSRWTREPELRRAATVEAQQKRLLNLLVDGVISRDDYDMKRRELEDPR